MWSDQLHTGPSRQTLNVEITPTQLALDAVPDVESRFPIDLCLKGRPSESANFSITGNLSPKLRLHFEPSEGVLEPGKAVTVYVTAELLEPEDINTELHVKLSGTSALNGNH